METYTNPLTFYLKSKHYNTTIQCGLILKQKQGPQNVPKFIEKSTTFSYNTFS